MVFWVSPTFIKYTYKKVLLKFHIMYAQNCSNEIEILEL